MSVHPAESMGDWAVPDDSDSMKILEDVDVCIVEQLLDMLEVASHIDMPNKYKIYNEDEKQMFFLEEVPTGVTFMNRAFDVIAKDANGKKVFSVERDFKQCSYCFFCCACCDACKSEAKVKVGGKKVGEMKQKWSMRNVKFELEDDDDKDVFFIDGKIECCSMKAEYEIYKKEGKKKIGTIKRLNEGLGKGCNKYKIKFPEDTSVKHKAFIIGACILFDYRFHYYVDPTAHHNNRRRRRR